MKPNRDDTAAYKKRTEDALFRAVMSLEDIHQCRNFFKDLCTPAELQALDWTDAVTVRRHDWVWRLEPAAYAGFMMSRSLLKPWIAAVGEAGATERLTALAKAHAAPDGLAEMPVASVSATRV